MKLYVGVGVAWSWSETKVSIDTLHYVDASEAEAYATALARLKEHYPESDGYTQYDVKLEARTREDVAQWLAAYDEEVAG